MTEKVKLMRSINNEIETFARELKLSLEQIAKQYKILVKEHEKLISNLETSKETLEDLFLSLRSEVAFSTFTTLYYRMPYLPISVGFSIAMSLVNLYYNDFSEPYLSGKKPENNTDELLNDFVTSTVKVLELFIKEGLSEVEKKEKSLGYEEITPVFFAQGNNKIN